MRCGKNDVIFRKAGEYLKLDSVKTMGIHEKINAIWRNITISLQKLLDVCGHKLPTNVKNFTQKDLPKWKYSKKNLKGLLFETPCSRWFNGKRPRFPPSSKKRILLVTMASEIYRRWNCMSLRQRMMDAVAVIWPSYKFRRRAVHSFYTIPWAIGNKPLSITCLASRISHLKVRWKLLSHTLWCVVVPRHSQRSILLYESWTRGSDVAATGSVCWTRLIRFFRRPISAACT